MQGLQPCCLLLWLCISSSVGSVEYESWKEHGGKCGERAHLQELCEATRSSREWHGAEYGRPWEWTVNLAPNVDGERRRSQSAAGVGSSGGAHHRGRGSLSWGVPGARGEIRGDGEKAEMGAVGEAAVGICRGSAVVTTGTVTVTATGSMTNLSSSPQMGSRQRSWRATTSGPPNDAAPTHSLGTR